MRQILAVTFAVVVWAIGGALTVASNELIAEVGRGIFYSTFLFYGLLLIMYIMSEQSKEELPLRVIHVAWVVSTLMPPIILFANPAPLATPQIGQAIAMFTSVWVTYWGVRYINEGTFSRQKDEEEETPIGI